MRLIYNFDIVKFTQLLAIYLRLHEFHEYYRQTSLTSWRNDFRKLNTSSFTDELEAAAYKSKTDEILENSRLRLKG